VSDAAIINVSSVVALKTFTNAVAIVSQTEIDFPRGSRLPARRREPASALQRAAARS